MTKKEKFIVYSDVPHTHTRPTHAPHTPHTHTSHTHHRQTNHIHTTYTHTISHKHHTRPSLSTHFLQLNSLNSSYSGFSCHAGADLSLAYSPTGNLKGFKYFLEGEPVWRLRRLVGFVDCGREVRADSVLAARAQGNRTLAELHHVSQGVNSWLSGRLLAAARSRSCEPRLKSRHVFRMISG